MASSSGRTLVNVCEAMITDGGAGRSISLCFSMVMFSCFYVVVRPS